MRSATLIQILWKYKSDEINFSVGLAETTLFTFRPSFMCLWWWWWWQQLVGLLVATLVAGTLCLASTFHQHDSNSVAMYGTITTSAFIAALQTLPYA